MFLSNAGRAVATIYLCAAMLAACGSSQPAVNTGVIVAPEAQKNIPFSLKEPDVYQAEVQIVTGDEDERFGIARKGERWRFDMFDGQNMSMSQLRSDRLYYIDHARKLYAVAAEPGDPMTPSLPPDPMDNFYNGRGHFDFEEAGRDGATIKYKVVAKDPIFIYYDTEKGMITRQEFLGSDGWPNIVYELRDIRMEVSDAVFELPKGYRKAALSEVAPGK
jgi:hypothetical protein